MRQSRERAVTHRGAGSNNNVTYTDPTLPPRATRLLRVRSHDRTKRDFGRTYRVDVQLGGKGIDDTVRCRAGIRRTPFKATQLQCVHTHESVNRTLAVCYYLRVKTVTVG